MTQLYFSKGFFPREYFRETSDYIVRTQLPSGEIPWFEGGHSDPWDHVESAMALSIAGHHRQARQAYYWLRDMQLENGAWWSAYVDSIPKDDSLRMETNFVAYIATGVWHHFTISADDRFLHSMWPTVERAIEFVIGLQTENGDIYWNIDAEKGVDEDSLITGCCSIYKSLECALNIAAALGHERPNWILSRARLGNALRNHPEYFDRQWESKGHFAMDWYYPVLTGVITGNSARAHLTSRWSEFVEPSLGCRCLSTNPWVTVAESCELVLALLAAGEHQKATQLYSWLHDYRELDGAYWTGYVFTDDAVWPEEKPTWTAAAVLLAADALTEATPAYNLFTDVSLPASVEYA